MKVSDYIEPAMIEMVSKKEDAIKAALDSFWQVWSLEDIKRRCRFARAAGSPVETLYADGVPLLEFHPLETETVPTETGWTIRVTQKFRDLRPALRRS